MRTTSFKLHPSSIIEIPPFLWLDGVKNEARVPPVGGGRVGFYLVVFFSRVGIVLSWPGDMRGCESVRGWLGG